MVAYLFSALVLSYLRVTPIKIKILTVSNIISGFAVNNCNNWYGTTSSVSLIKKIKLEKEKGIENSLKYIIAGISNLKISNSSNGDRLAYVCCTKNPSTSTI